MKLTYLTFATAMVQANKLLSKQAAFARLSQDCQDTTNGVTDDWGDGCEWYEANDWGCGFWSNPDSGWDSAAMCCVCGGGSSGGSGRMDDEQEAASPTMAPMAADPPASAEPEGSDATTGEPPVADNGAVEWSKEDAKACFDYMNEFRADPAGVWPLTQEQIDIDYPIGEAQTAYIWSDELYDLAQEHTMNMANLEAISHDGVMERFDRVEGCFWQSWGENVAYNMEEGDAALRKAIEQWAGSINGHRSNMANPDWQYAAIGVASNGNSVYFTGKFMACFEGTVDDEVLGI